jgi:riboflavin kinase / FMN adenylyltransferase
MRAWSMRHVHSLEEAGLSGPSAVTIGVFDGIHRGHQHIIKQFVNYAKEASLTPVVLTFFPYPDTVLHGFRQGYYLTLPDAKAAMLAALGVEVIVTYPFNDEVRHMRAAAFVEQLLSHLKMRALWVGADFAMGYQREGNVPFLTSEAAKLRFDLRVVDLMDADNEHVSSTRVRQALENGDVVEAARLLGRPHRLPGVVVKGAGRGRTINIPTANLSFPEEQAIPARGVYAAWAGVGSEWFPAVVNIGVRPTFDGAGGLTVEAHLLDFGADLYGQTLELDFVERIRDEQKFQDVQSLVDQIHRDIEKARKILPPSGIGNLVQKQT